MEVKAWSHCSATIINFFKATLLNEKVTIISKNSSFRKEDKGGKEEKSKEKSSLMSIRLKIISDMFSLISKVNRSVHESAYDCIKQLIDKEEHPK